MATTVIPSPLELERRMRRNAQRAAVDLPDPPQGYRTYMDGSVAGDAIDCSDAAEPDVSIWAIGQVQRIEAELRAVSGWRLVRRWRLRRGLRRWRGAVARGRS